MQQNDALLRYILLEQQLQLLRLQQQRSSRSHKTRHSR
jgi:hypothetical protein